MARNIVMMNNGIMTFLERLEVSAVKTHSHTHTLTELQG